MNANEKQKDIEALSRQQETLKQEHPKLFAAVSALLYDHDPQFVNFWPNNPDEYDPEAGTIIPRLGDCESAGQVADVIHEELTSWFGSSWRSRDELCPLAEDIWRVWNAHLEDPDSPLIARVLERFGPE